MVVPITPPSSLSRSPQSGESREASCPYAAFRRSGGRPHPACDLPSHRIVNGRRRARGNHTKRPAGKHLLPEPVRIGDHVAVALDAKEAIGRELPEGTIDVFAA